MNKYFLIFCCAFLLPLIMILVGAVFVKRPPIRINSVYGYRTQMSMLNRDTWNFAHHHCGKVWLAAGVVMLVLSAAAVYVVVSLLKKDFETPGFIIMGVQLAVMIASIIPTELALRKNFNKDGSRK